MSAARKLQAEIDKTTKKIEEGIAAYDDLFDETNAADGSQRERLEEILKKELKKLQREREKVKAWANRSDIREKDKLLQCRSDIERRMEAFKELERQSKTKAFSKAGLARGTAETPEERERREECEWLQDQVDILEKEAEELEAEIETMAEERTADSEEAEALAEQFGNHQFHIENLQRLIRLLMNELVSVEQVSELHDDIEYYVEEWREPEFYADREIYIELADVGLGTAEEADKAVEKLLDKIGDDADDDEEADVKQPEPEQAPKSAAALKSKSSSGASKAPAAAAASGGSSSASSRQGAPAAISAPGGASGGSTQGGASTPGLGKWGAGAPAAITGGATPTAGSASSMADMLKSASATQPAGGNAVSSAPAPAPVPTAAPVGMRGRHAAAEASGVASSTPQSVASGGVSSQPVPELTTPREGMPKPEELEKRFKLLQSTLFMLPERSDAERPAAYTPMTPMRGHASFPMLPATPLTSPEAFEKFDTDTLFFIFYYQQGTKAQYLAAAELKKRSWRFHKAYRTWLRRHGEVAISTDKYEKGDFTFFDYEKGWKTKVKKDFKCEFALLEDELQVV